MYEKIYRLRGKIYSIVVMKGDCNDDYAVNLADVVLLQKYLLREIEDFRHPEAADYNGDKKLNAIDLSLLKHYLLRTEDEQINDWLKDWSGKYHVMIDYSAWTEKLTAVSAECETGCNKQQHQQARQHRSAEARPAGGGQGRIRHRQSLDDRGERRKGRCRPDIPSVCL